MLGLSIGKLLVILGVIGALWQGIRMLGSLRDAVDRKNHLDAQREAERRKAAAVSTTEMVECPKCGTFVPNATFRQHAQSCTARRAT